MKLFNFELVRIWPPTAQNNMSREVKFCKEANIFTSWRRKRIVFCPHCARGFNFYIYKLHSEEDFERIKNQEKVEVATWNIIHLFQLCNSRPCFFVKFTTFKTTNTKEGITRFHFNLSPLPSSYQLFSSALCVRYLSVTFEQKVQVWVRFTRIPTCHFLLSTCWARCMAALQPGKTVAWIHLFWLPMK